MEKKITIVGMVVFALIATGAGCSKNSNNTQSSDSAAIVEEYQEYNWTEQGIIFKYPKDVLLAKIPGFTNLLYFAPSWTPEAELNAALSGAGFPTVMMVYQETTLERVLERSFSDGGLKSKTEVNIGGRVFTKFEYYDSYAKSNDVYYMLPLKDGVLAYRDGEDGMGNALFTLASLQF